MTTMTYQIDLTDGVYAVDGIREMPADWMPVIDVENDEMTGNVIFKAHTKVAADIFEVGFIATKRGDIKNLSSMFRGLKVTLWQAVELERLNHTGATK